MEKKLVLPVFVLERETGDMNVFLEIDQLRLHVEEFWDVLDEEFLFWDIEGSRIQFPKSFLSPSSTNVEAEPESDKLNLDEHISSFLRRIGRVITGNSIQDLLDALK